MVTGVEAAAAAPIEGLAEFRSELSTRSAEEIVRRYITYGSCRKLDDEQYYKLKHKISNHYRLHPSEIAVVGSAKLGFSIAPQKRYQPFHDSSDIDVAIVSSRLFDIVWREVYTYSQEVTYWPERDTFFSYLIKGWIRPDKLPRGKSFVFSEKWFTFFRILSNSKEFGDISINAGLYKDWLYLEKYQEKSVVACVNSER